MRIFWAFNNKWLIENEVSALVAQGYSVFIPKIPVISADSIVTYRYDEGLNLSKEILDELNNYDFFSHVIERRIVEIINSYFDVVIMDYNTHMLQGFILFYQKKLIVRPLEYSPTMNITERIKDDLGFWALNRIERIKNRFFVSLYGGKVIDNNDIISSEYMLNMPLFLSTLKPAEVAKKNNDILFICPEVKSNNINYNNYKKFEIEFKDFSYQVIGKQLISVTNNRKIVNIKLQENYYDYFGQYKVLVYLSTDDKEIPYYLFEAFSLGLPVVFLKGGFLDAFETNEFTGRCDNLDQAKKLCKKIIRGNKKIIDTICNEQNRLLSKIMEDSTKNFTYLNEVVFDKPLKKNNDNKKRKLALIMPAEYTGGVLDYSIRLALAIKRGAEITGNDLDIVFGYKEHINYDKKEFFNELIENSIKLRPYKWETLGKDRVKEICLIKGYNIDLSVNEYSSMNDGISYFEDCDCILFTADRVPNMIYTMVPYGMILHDYIQRYIPQIMSNINEQNFIETARKAVMNFTTTNVVRTDSIQYAGIEASRINLIPLFFGVIDDVDCNNKLINDIGDYFVWSTNTSSHKNHKFALNALIKYYEAGGTLKCVMTGADTNKFDLKVKFGRDAYIEEIRAILKQNKVLVQNIYITGNMPKHTYLKTLKGAKFFLHPGCADNGNGTAFDAAMLGVPTLSCDYPAMRNMDEKTNINMIFFDYNNIEGLVDLLFKMEKRNKKWQIPSRNELEKFIITNDELCVEIYKVFHQYLPI